MVVVVGGGGANDVNSGGVQVEPHDQVWIVSRRDKGHGRD